MLIGQLALSTLPITTLATTYTEDKLENSYRSDESLSDSYNFKNLNSSFDASEVIDYEELASSDGYEAQMETSITEIEEVTNITPTAITNTFQSAEYRNGRLRALTRNYRVGDSVSYRQIRDGSVISQGSTSLLVYSGIINKSGYADFFFHNNDVWANDRFELTLRGILGLIESTMIYIVPRSNVSTTLPILNGVPMRDEIYRGSQFDPMEGVWATDFRGVDITEEITITGRVDTNTLGTYSLIYAVTDFQGRSTVAQRLVSVIPNPEIMRTTIEPLTTNSRYAKGRAEPGSTVSIKVADLEIGSGISNEEGQYEISIPPQELGVVVTAQANRDGILSNIASTTVERGSIDETTISELNTDSTSVTGTAEPNAEISIKVGDIIIAQGRVGSDGIYSLTIERQQAGTIVTAQANLNGILSNIAETTVVRARISETILNSVTTSSTTVTGIAEPDAHVEITIGDSETKSTTVSNEGHFEVEIDPQSAGTIITAQASIDGLHSNIASTIVITDPTNLEGTITPNQYRLGDTSITGTFTGDINFANLVIDGQSVNNWGGTFNKETGSFDFFVHPQFREQIRTAEKVELQTYHRETVDGQMIDHKLVLQPIEIIRVEGEIYPDTFKLIDNEITGTFTGDVNLINLIVDGQSVSWGGSFDTTNQIFTYLVNQTTQGLIRNGEKVELVAYHREIIDGQPVDIELDRKVLTVEKDLW